MADFIKNSWYVCASTDEILYGKLFERVIINEPVVFYRTNDGKVVALENRCCHRHYPLSKGTLEGNSVRCGYHGFLYQCTGECIEIPGQTTIPRNAKVHRYPTVERYTWVWIWMGDPELADEKNIPDYHWMSDPGWRSKSDLFYVKSNHRLIVQNLLDLSHLAFVHGSTIGTRAVIDSAQVKFERGDNEVRISRWMIDIKPPATYHKLATFEGNVDRWQIIHFIPPGFVRIYGGACPTGTGAPQGDRKGGLELMNLHAVTPETDKTTHYFWSQCHKGMLDRPDITNVLFDDVLIAFREDHVLFEAQQRMIDMDPSRPTISAMSDVGMAHAMRILDRLEAEQAAGTMKPVGADEIKLTLA